MDLRLISYTLCPYVHRATTVLHEKGVPFRIDYVDLENKPDWFLALSPRGKVPLVVVDDATPLFESAVINEFIDETYPTPRLLPDDALARAQHRAWIEVANDLFVAEFKTVFGSTTKEDYEAARSQLEGVLDRFETFLRGPFFAGENFGLVDAAAAPALYRLVLLEEKKGFRVLDPKRFPKTRDWARRLADRPSVINGVRSDFEQGYFALITKRGSHFARTLFTSSSSSSGAEATA